MQSDDFIPNYMVSVFDDIPTPDLTRNTRINPMALELQRIAYELFKINPDGGKFFEHLKDEVFMKQKIDMGKPGADLAAVYLEGKREVVRMIQSMILSHQQHINSQRGA